MPPCSDFAEEEVIAYLQPLIKGYVNCKSVCAHEFLEVGLLTWQAML